MKTRSMLFVDDHPIYREGLERVLASAMDDLAIATAADIAAALAMLDADPMFDLCLTDQRLPDGDGADLLQAVRRRFPAIAVGILSADVTPALAAEVRSRGGVACLSKQRDSASIATAIQVLFDGGTVFDSGLASSDGLLSPRRREIVRMAAAGKVDKQISVQLNITESTVRNHWQHIFDQLGAANRTEAVTKALRLRLI